MLTGKLEIKMSENMTWIVALIIPIGVFVYCGGLQLLLGQKKRRQQHKIHPNNM